MTYSIDQIKGEISRGGGIAKGNLFRVIMPIIPALYLNTTGPTLVYPQSMNALCKNVTMPGRQLMTSDREIGVVNQKVAYGYANDDITITFIGLNDYATRKYLEDWQNYAVNPDTHELKYKADYSRTIVIEALDMEHRVVYGVRLKQAFPTQLLNIDYSNDANSLVDVTATFSYTKWERTGFLRDIGSTVVQDILEDTLLRG